MYYVDMTKKKRPPTWVKDPARVKGSAFLFRLGATEKEGFTAAADLSGLTLAAWMRERMRWAAADELRKAGQPVPFIAAGGT